MTNLVGEVRQHDGPEPLHPGTHRGQARRIDRVEPARAYRTDSDELGVTQHGKVLAHRGPAHREALGDLSRRHRPTLTQQLEDPAAGRVAQGVERDGKCVSAHLRK